MRQARRALACIVLPIQMVACTSWQTIPPGPDRAMDIAREERVRVTLVSSEEREVHQPQLGESELSGVSVRCAGTAGSRQSTPCEAITIPLSEIIEISSSHFDLGKTGLLVGGLAAALGIALYAAVANTCYAFCY
jgi:hypothetical protein